MSGRGRGRGRGGARGRGGSRGRGGRGASRGRGGGRGRGGRNQRGGRGRGNRGEDNRPAVAKEVEVPLDIDKDLQKYFVGTASFEQHYDAQEANRDRYIAGLIVMNKSGIEISQNARIRALASAWARADRDLVKSLLTLRETFGLVEVSKAIELLDSARKVRVEEKKLTKLEYQAGGKITPQKRGKFKSTIDNLNAVRPKCGSASGAVCKQVKRWAKTFSQEDLEFYALHYPAGPWCKLADICHFHPVKDFNLDWFLPFCFGKPAPEGSMVARCKELTAENVNPLLEEFDIPFTHVKQFQSALTVKSKTKIAACDKLDKVIWNYEDLQCTEVDTVIEARLKKGETFELPYGKLMERLLTIKMIRENIPASRGFNFWGYNQNEADKKDPAAFTKAPFLSLLVPFAEAQLEQLHLPLEAPVVVMGDKSSSMDVAIRTSTIIASLLAAITSAKLVFFNNENEDIAEVPRNIEQVLDMAVTVRATGSTAPAASLYPFYERKEVVKTFVIVTDEEENTACKGFKFHDLYKKYCENVYNARMVFVSFLRNQHSEGQMVREFNQKGTPVMQFKFDQSRPDLTKLDTLFGLLSAESSDFEGEVSKLQERLKVDGMNKVFEDLKI